MEAESISQSSSLQFPTNPQHLFEISHCTDYDIDLTNRLAQLFEKGLPIFVFQDNLQKQENKNQSILNDQKSSFLNERILTYNRKAKSLEELSKKFIQHFEGKGNNIIQLDKITEELGVERRRIYDVINILESLNVVTKKGKNNYIWKGLCEAVRTIKECSNQKQNLEIQNFKKEKSLQYLASGFLKLFINWKPAISLEEAAKQMMKEMDEAAIKTKIRRLYDIINVFRSLGLVRKASLSSKRPGYEWAGTEYLEHLIIKKQYYDENTGLNELQQEEDAQNSEEKNSAFLYGRNGVFSPYVCPQIPKLSFGSFKHLTDTKEPRSQEEQKGEAYYFKQDLLVQTHQFPIFRKTTSAFTLVAEGKKQHQ